MLPNISQGRASRAASRGRSRSRQRDGDAEVDQEEVKIQQDQDQLDVAPPPQAEALPPAVGVPQLNGALPANAAMPPPAARPAAARQDNQPIVVQHVLPPPGEKISTLVKNIVKLAHGNFSAWLKAINSIAYYRRWDKSLVMNPNHTWDKVEERDPGQNQQRRDAFWVLSNSLPYGSDFYHLQTGVEEGDANELYKKVVRIFLAKNPQNRAELRKQFYNLTMGSTKLDVSRFAAKVVQTADDLQKIGARLEEDETTTRFLDGLSKKFDDIITVQRVAKNDFDTTLTNVIEYATVNKLLAYRETSFQGHHHMAREPEPSKHYRKPSQKKFFKKKTRPSK